MAFNEDTSFIEYNVEQPTQDFVTNFDTIGGTTDVVLVTVDGVLTDTPESSYTVQQINHTTWRVTPEVPADSVVRLYRVTNIDEMMHVFTAGAKFIARNMDSNFKQIRHAQQEVRDAFDFLEYNTLGVVEAAKDATELANTAAQEAYDAAAQVNDKVSYQDLDNAVEVAVAPVRGYTALPFQTGKTYALYERVQLDNGDIVKSTIDGNTNDPNVDMTGWKYPTVKINDSHKDLDYIVNDAIYPYLSRSDRDGMIITADMFDQMLAVARTVDKPLKFRKTDTFELDRSIVIPNFGVELPNIAQLEVDFGGAQVIPLVDDLICFKILAENVTFRQPHFNNRDNKSNCWAYRLGAENDQVAGDPSNQRISTNRFKIYDPICYRFYGFQWVKPAASIGGTMVDGVMQGGTLSGSYYGDVFNPRIQQTYIHFWFDYCVTHDNMSTVWNIYNPQTLGGNCAYLLDNIAGLNVFGGSFEFIDTPDLLPDATVIRVRGRQNENSPYATNNCNFFGLTGESLTRFYHVDNKGYLGDALSLINCTAIAPALPSIGTAGQTSTSFEGDINVVTANGSVPSVLAWDKVSNRSIAMIAGNVPRLSCVPSHLGVPDTLKTETGSLKLGTQADSGTNEYVSIDYLERDMIFHNRRGGGFAFERSGGAFDAKTVYPRLDAGLDLGAPSNRWSTIFAVNGVIQTSDIRHKTNIQDISELENKVALKLKSLIKKFKFKDAVADKGENARYHIGVIAQEVEAAFAEFNLNAFDYGILCFDEWKEGESSIASSDGNIYSVRYDELMMFILASV